MNSLLSRLNPNRGTGEGDVSFALTGDLPRPLVAKAFSKLYKSMDKVVKSLQNPRLSLSRSPPCLIDTLPEIYMKLKEINSVTETPNGEQSEFYYITVNNIYDKCKRVNQLFKEHREEIFQETADSRKQLINLTIVITYIFADLKALFNESSHFEPNFRIAKEDAERWWKTTFPLRVIVPWGTFKEQIIKTYPSLNKLELSKLKSTIDLTCNDHVSVFEFDVFTRLFAPWMMLMKNFKKLTFHPGYMASATFENVKTTLSRHREKPGSYVFRMSCTKLGFWSIGYVTDHSEQRRDRIAQIVVRDGKPIVEALMEGAQKGYYLYPNGEPANPDLSDLMHVRPKPLFQVTQAQYEEYNLIDSTFQECKICNTRNKDIQLDLCGHFMCSKCLDQWLTKGSGCPFCRCEIRSTQPVVMEPFHPDAQKRDRKPSLCAAVSSSLTGQRDTLDSLPPPNHPPPDLPQGWRLEEDQNQPEPGVRVSPNSERSQTEGQAPRPSPRRRLPSLIESPPVQLPPRSHFPTEVNNSPSGGSHVLSDSCSSHSGDDPDSHYINLPCPNARTAMPLPEPPRQRTEDPPSSLRLTSSTGGSTMRSPAIIQSQTSPGSAASPPVTSPMNPTVMSPTNPPVTSPTNPTVMSPTNLPVTSPMTSPVTSSPTNPPVTSPTTPSRSSPRGDEGGPITARVPSSLQGAGAQAPELLTGLNNAKPARRPSATSPQTKDGDVIKSLPPPPPVPLETVAPPLPPNRPNASSVTSTDGPRATPSSPRQNLLTPGLGPRRDLRSLPCPPSRESTSSMRSPGYRSVSSLSQTPPFGAVGGVFSPSLTESEYNVPQAESEYNVPQAESEYNVPQAESEYNIPQAESEYNVPQAESEYNVPVSLMQEDYFRSFQNRY